jgi:hypothetical protein
MATVSNDKLADLIRTYRDATLRIAALESTKEDLRHQIVKAMTAKDWMDFTVDNLVARRGMRVDRKYRVTPALATLLERARVEAFVTSGPIDAAIKAKKLSADKVTPFAVGGTTPTFGVYPLKDGDTG